MKEPVYRRIDGKGRVYLPKKLMEALGLEPGGELPAPAPVRNGNHEIGSAHGSLSSPQQLLSRHYSSMISSAGTAASGTAALRSFHW